MELYMYAQSLADDRRARPMDDIVTTLVTAELDGEKLSDIEFNVFVLLLVGGRQRDDPQPDQRRDARADGEPGAAGRGSLADLDGLLPTAVDEMLRYVSPVQYFRRTAIGRHRAPRRADRRPGDKVTIWYGAANRDEEVFADPQRFDVGAHAERAHRVRRPWPALLPRARAWRRWRSR